MRTFSCLLAAILSLGALRAAPTRVLVIGDSMSEEYANELPFSAPDSNPSNPNTRNWVEILDAHRGADLDFGNDSAYFDLRLLGFEYNWGVPGATAAFWEDVFDSSLFRHQGYLNSKLSLLDQLDAMDVVVLFVGGNDVSSEYGNLYDNAPSPDLKPDYLERIGFIIDTLRDERADLPLVLVNVPDVGATPDIQCDHPDPAKRADATAHLADLNAQLATLAASKGAQLVDLFALTSLIIDPAPITIGPVRMSKWFDRENRPNQMFCKEKFHPASGTSALIGNLIVEGINELLGTGVTPLSEHEIASDVLGLGPYLEWMEGFPGADPDLLADEDHDGLPGIGEFALQGHPLIRDELPRPAVSEGTATITFQPDAAAADIVETVAEESASLAAWSAVPPDRLNHHADGRIDAELAATPQGFARLRFLLAP